MLSVLFVPPPVAVTLGTAGYFSGQTGYGYRSFEAFVDAVRQIESGAATAEVGTPTHEPSVDLQVRTSYAQFIVNGRQKQPYWYIVLSTV